MATDEQVIAHFCAANGRNSYDWKPHRDCFDRAALTIAIQAAEWPELKAIMEALIVRPDFCDNRLSMTVSVQERGLHHLLMAALLAMARDKNKHPATLRLEAWDALDAVKSAKAQN